MKNRIPGWIGIVWGSLILVIVLLVLAVATPRPQEAHYRPGVCVREGARLLGQRPIHVSRPPAERDRVQHELPRLPHGAILTSGWSGELLLDTRGDVVQVWPIGRSQVEPPHISFDELAVRAMRAWQYEPVVALGKPVPACLSLVLFIN